MVDAQQLITDNIDVWTSAIKKKSATGRGSSKKIELTGIKKLRELILELAVRGKLVPQDVNDEPASALLERIAEEKAQLIADKKIKKQKPLPVITDEEKPFDLPLGWEWARVGTVSSLSSGKGFKKSEYSDTGARLFQIANVSLGYAKWDIENYLPLTYMSDYPELNLSVGDVLIALNRPLLNGSMKVCILEESDIPAILYQRVGKFDFHGESIDTKYYYYFLQSPLFKGNLNENLQGSDQPFINQSQLVKFLFSLPPLAEQHRIVAKVDELMVLCDQLEQQTEQSLTAHQTLVEVLLGSLHKPAEGSATDNTDDFQANWQRISDHFDVLFTTEHSIEQLKQTILQLAVMGKLVPQNPNDEPASVLLEKIAKEKAQLIADKKIKKQKIQAIGDDVHLYKLPKGWTWSQLGKLTASEDHAMCDGPFGSKLKTEHYISDKGFSVVRLGNIGVGKFLWGKEGHISKEHYETLPNNHIQTGDLIVAGMADPLIRTCEVPPNLGPAVNKADCFRLRIHNYLEKKYISHYLNSHVAKLFAAEENQGMTRQRINLGNCKAIPVPIAPINEQHRIVAKVDELMALCEQLKARLSDAQTTQLHLADAVVENALSTNADTE